MLTPIYFLVTLLFLHPVAVTSKDVCTDDDPSTDCTSVRMTYNRLGNTGLYVSSIGFGAWLTFGQTVDEETATGIMQTAYDSGVNFFDNAEAYAGGEAEVVMGRIFKALGWKRSSFVVTTKIFWGPDGHINAHETTSRKHIIEGLNDSLKRLQLDYVDIVYCHRFDPNTPVEEVVRAMNYVINTGKAFYWGTSEWSAEQLEEAYRISGELGLIGPNVEQPQYNMLHRRRVEQEYATLYETRGLGTTIWSPLASGILTGKYNEDIPEASRFASDRAPWTREGYTRHQSWKSVLQIVRKLQPIADKLDCSLAQLAIAWTLKHPHVNTAITGATKVEQVRENIRALEVVDRLTPEVMEMINVILPPDL